MRIIFLCGCLLLGGIYASATHIAGGGIELFHLYGNRYRLNVILYFDKVNGNPEAKDPEIRVNFFTKRTNNFLFSKVLALESEEAVSYTEPKCSNGEIVTDRLVYSKEVILNPAVFNDPEGYYIVWERCCRNYVISNMFSEDPEIPGSIAAGNTFYLAFPAVVKDGKPFINSSPTIQSVLNDYACPGIPYYARLTAQDIDGDSLAYSVTTPYSTHTSEAIPASTHAAPYPTMQWRPGYNLGDVLGGSSRLAINSRGILTATPFFQGLHALAIKVEEYRNGELIGVSIRDYQILVLDQCDKSVPPQITGPTSVTIPYDRTGADRCITVTVSDADSQDPLKDFSEKVKIRAVGLSFFDENLTEILPIGNEATLQNGSTQDFSICFPKCPLDGANPYRVGIIVEDEVCSLPRLDTLEITVNTPYPNTPPYFVEPANVANAIPVQVMEGEQIILPFAVRDDDGDVLSLSIEAADFIPADAGITVEWDTLSDNSLQGTTTWSAFCDVYDFSQRAAFPLKINVSEQDKCNVQKPPISLAYNLNVNLPQSNSPVIDTDLTSSSDERIVTGLERNVFEFISFEVTGEDRIDNDTLALRFLGSEALGITQDSQLPEDWGITFTEARGVTTVRSTFDMDIQCRHLKNSPENHIVDLQFVVTDSKDKCNIYRSDTVQVDLAILPPDNTMPRITITSLNDNLYYDVLEGKEGAIDITVDGEVILGIQGFDAEPEDSLYLSLTSADNDPPLMNYVFEPVTGSRSLSTTFAWNPDCSIFQDEAYQQEYELQFSVKDNRCFNSLSDSIQVKIRVTDTERANADFQPINFFSPNGDGKNDYYAMLQIDTNSGQLVNILPEDNCNSQFQSIQVYNRWGVQVFKSESRDFKWYGGQQSAGVYYYLIKYSDKTYKGTLSIRY